MRTLLPVYAQPAAVAHGDVTVVLHSPGGDAPAAARLSAAGVPVLGRVDLGYADRPVADILDDVDEWSALPVDGVFLDRAPTSPFNAGPVALAIRCARRAGLPAAVLNPAVPTDPVYRDLGAAIVAFEGCWADYQRWSGHGSAPGDGHLVYGVPAAQLHAARRLMVSRGAGFGLVTDRGLPRPYHGLPAWCTAPDMLA